MTTQKPATSTPITSYTHTEATRTNIPTEELRSFVPDDEKTPPMLYPRDPSLDPQLVWKGKDEQDRQDLSVPVVPIYIQEKIQPRAIIEQVRAEARSQSDRMPALFADFNGIEFEELIDFYNHQQHWTNRMILGDSLLVMTSLAEKERLKGKVQMIYMDPPYGIKFGSNWQVSTRRRDVKDGRSDDMTRQPEQIKAFRDTWELGIHSYLTYLRDRLVAARELLTETGSIFVQIGDENVHLVRCVLDEVFGSENSCGQITFVKTSGLGSSLLADRFDYLLWYAKDRDRVKYRQLYFEKSIEEGTASNYSWVELPDGVRRGMQRREKENTSSLPVEAKIYKPDNITSQGNPVIPYTYRGRPYQQAWKTNLEGMATLAKADRLHVTANTLQYVRYLTDFPSVPITKLWTDTATGSFTDDKIYVVQTGTKTIERCMLMTTDPGDLVLDPTCGSGTTAYVAEQWGRRWITTDTSRVALALARTRLMSARFPYYYLADSQDGARKEAEVTHQFAPDYAYGNDIRKGFVYKRVPHVTLKSIANNAEIDTIYAKWQEQMEPVRARLNQTLGKAWEEWQIPREAESDWPEAARQLHAAWWEGRRKRQQEIDASIARNADTELLYDQPYEDAKRIRVSGPFTVESLSPHRVISPDVERPASEVEGQRDDTAAQFATMVLDNLRKAGVQNTIKGERLVFDTLEPFAGRWLQARGTYTDKTGEQRTVFVSIGAQYGTVGADQVKEAAKEAMRGAGADMLVICAFAFDAHADETAKEFTPEQQPVHDGIFAESVKQYGKLPVLLARMNPDLHIGGDLLKQTGAGNLFMVFGEPDIQARRADGKITVHIRGVDVFDPTTGQIRSSSTDEIACWFIDTNYNGESFFVRHAYFTGATEPYEKLKRALRAEVDESVWSRLYSAESWPFDPPETGKIAIKVINHYGDEVLKVYEVA